MNVDKELKQYLTQRFFHGDAGKIKDDESLFEQGIIDSLGVLQLVSFLEEHFGVHVDDEDLVPENFDTVNRIREFVESKLVKTAK